MVLIDVTNELLNKPEYFTCERLHCLLRIDVCLGRIKANKQPRRPLDPIPFPDCEGCVQGKINIQQAMDKVDRQGKPKRGKGQRNETCEFYNICLDLAAKKDWKTWNCKNCDHYGGNKAVTEKIENTRICSECRNRTTISPANDLCASCMARKSNEARKTNTKGKGKPEKSSHVPILSFEINFDQYKTLFDQINDLATEQIRTPEQQILYLLKTHPNLVKIS